MKTILTTTIGLIIGLLLNGQTEVNNISTHDLIQKQSDAIFDSLVNIRRDLHMNPEISGQEKRTSKVIEEYLLRLGLEVKTNIGGYGVVGILKGDKKGRKIAWRADIDALKTDFPDPVDFKSKKEGERHICGHDIHTVIGLGIANVLAKQKSNIKGTVYFIFQPAEEKFAGAKSMIDDGIFNVIKPDEIYGLHMFPNPTGIISTKPGECFSYRREISITFTDKIDVDEIKELSKSIARELFSVKPNSKPWEFKNLTDPDVGLLNKENIYQDYLMIQEYFDVSKQNDRISFKNMIFCTDENNLDSVPEKIKQIILKTKHSKQFVSVDYVSDIPIVINDSKLTKNAIDIISGIYGEEYVLPCYGQVPFFNDDFAYFQKHIPGVYFLIGGSNAEKGLNSMPHAPDFAVDEDCINVGVKYFSSLIIERVNSK